MGRTNPCTRGENMSFSEKMSWAMLGLLYIAAGLIILRWPTTLYYAVAVIFFVQGAVSLWRVFKR